ncbi:hypothetical protein EPUS_03975 [Endocarpon pusillum Z07020]|uniref:Enoyl reductase (ER) domain-containing protein n=1 Tax=Endocarpon pusillum (strain Z07020 / HMAS-L-300199) TaxID=1263415 RepID=U1GC52_ENDPU|nr:uncharacterized protein EPUS_03975 [Endocarpon pusillum Z07020]ERF69271.1 hypothetical protein EPUS_03975 [Endocarpon pusillum Z07020]
MGAEEVVATCSGANVEMVGGLGVDEVIDYRAMAPLPDHLARTYSDRPFDVILDTVGTQALYERSPSYLKPNGVYINVGALEGFMWSLWCWAKNTLWPTILGGTPRRYIMFSTVPNGKSAEKLADMVETGKVRVVVDSVFGMDEVLEAYDRLASKRAKGKIVIKIQDD